MLYSSGEMDRKRLGILYPVILIGMGVALAFVNAAFGAGLRLHPDPSGGSPPPEAPWAGPQGRLAQAGQGLDAAGFYQGAAPTPAAKSASRAGSTNGIVWLGFVIVAIVLLPILLRRSVWTK